MDDASISRHHPETGEPLVRDARPLTAALGPLWTTIEVPGWYPAGEGDSIRTGSDLEAWEEAAHHLRRLYGARLQIRTSPGLTVDEAGRVAVRPPSL